MVAKFEKKFELRVVLGFVLKRMDREHPNLDWRFNSIARVETADIDLSLNDERTAILIRVSHPDFENGVFGSVSVNGLGPAKALAAFVSARKGKTVEEVVREIRDLDTFNLAIG
jgi:hypothetical protein